MKTDKESLTIGILDIYGFEIFQKNGMFFVFLIVFKKKCFFVFFL